MINKFEKQHSWLSAKIKKKFWAYVNKKENYSFVYHLTSWDFALRLNSRDDSVSKQIFFNNFEQDTCKFIERVIKGDEIIFDIGANIGFYTLLFSRLVVRAGSVHAFEPSRREFLSLSENVAINDAKNVFLNQIAVSNQNGFEGLNVMDDERFGAFNSLASINHPRVRGASTHEEFIRVITIDAYCQLFSMAPDLIKIDVEGVEKRVLMGAASLLSSENAPMIILEVFEHTLAGDGNTADSLSAFLYSLNYTLFSISLDGKLTPMNLGASLNCVAFKKKHLEIFHHLIVL